MSTRRKHDVLEISGRDVDDAIAKGLDQLGVSRDEVFIEILNQGRRRLFGLSTEPARVRILYPVAEGAGADEGAQEEVVASVAEEPPAFIRIEEPQEMADLPTSAPEVQVETEAEEAPERQGPEPESDFEEEVPPRATEEEARVAQEAVKELLERMGIEAQVALDRQEDQILVLDISGQGVDALVGRYGETLNALQYIARMIVSRELQHWVTFFLNVDGFRERRAQELEELARRIAERVAMDKQPLALEPMPAHERRIVHIALRGHPLVMTQSVGQGGHRRVTIVPRQ